MGLIRSLFASTCEKEFVVLFPKTDFLDIVITSLFCYLAVRLSHQYRINSRISILDLPDETLLNIAEHLNPEDELLLSLSCKKLYRHNQVFRQTALPVSGTKSSRVNFLQILERDHPEYLTCRDCAIMYSWQTSLNNDHDCPHSSGYDPDLSHDDQTLRILPPRTVVDLIWRGPQKGFPVTRLNFSGVYNDLKRVTEARSVNGQLMLFSEWTWIVRNLDFLLLSQSPMTTPLCWHRKFSWRYHTWLIWRGAPSGVKCFRTGLKRCSHCATDFQIQVNDPTNKPIVVTIQVWHNLGSRDHQTQATSAIFDAYAPKLDKDVVVTRDLKKLFNSGSVSLWRRFSRAFFKSEPRPLPDIDTTELDRIPAT